MRLIITRSFKTYSSNLSNKYFVTTPIYYVNASPHIGHLYSSLIADATVRWRMLYDPGNYKFSTGTDEHGTKVQQSAVAHSVSLNKYCDEISHKYRDLATNFNVNCTDFIRTTEERHKNAVQHFWRTINENGYIYSSKYTGWYCVPDETFLVDSQLKEIQNAKGKTIKVSEESGHPVEWTEEVNYMFKLTKLLDDVKGWIQKENSVRPKKFQKILLDMMSDGLPDISISRPVNRVHWGIKVPDDESQTVYVWLDALVSYLTAAGYPDKSFQEFWPPNLHVIGKDILKFHGIYWPAFLMAANLEPPRSILCHSHWTVDGEKMSKSKKNVVCPTEMSKIYTSDGFRYFLLREGVAHSDGNYSDIKVQRYLNSELADNFGNLLSRCCGKALNPDQVFPDLDQEAFEIISSTEVAKQLMSSVKELPEIVATHYEQQHFHKVVDSTLAILQNANLFFETTKPWVLRKSTSTLKQVNVVLHLTLETLRVCSIALSPIIPNLSKKIISKINVPQERSTWKSLQKLSWEDANFKSDYLSSESAVVFQRIQNKEEENTVKQGDTNDNKKTQKLQKIS